MTNSLRRTLAIALLVVIAVLMLAFLVNMKTAASNFQEAISMAIFIVGLSACALVNMKLWKSYSKRQNPR